MNNLYQTINELKKTKEITRAEHSVLTAMAELSTQGTVEIKNQKAIADLAGYSREYTNRILRKLEYQGTIEKLAPTYEGLTRYQIKA